MGGKGISMYRVDIRSHKHKRARRIGWLWAGVLLIALIVYLLFNVHITPQETLRSAPPISTNYTTSGANQVKVDKPLFTMELPAAWKERGPELAVIPGGTYTFQSASQPAQILALYIDNIPSTMPVNEAIAVSPQGNGLAYNAVSGNCTTYTDASKTDTQTKVAPARWQNISFLCDMGNYNRGVVGTESTEGINQVTVAGLTKGSHKLFIRYTDNMVSPDYGILYDILGSLQFK